MLRLSIDSSVSFYQQGVAIEPMDRRVLKFGTNSSARKVSASLLHAKEEEFIMPAEMLAPEELIDRVARVIHERTGRMVRGLRIHLQEDGQVVLRGLSPSYYYKQLASHAAMDELAGQGVTNEIQVI